MKQEQYNENNRIQEESLQTDMLEQMLSSIYPKEGVPDTAKIRLQNRIACQKAMETGKVSFWWLPATIATTISIVAAAFLCLGYVIVNMVGAHSWMPHFLQFTSELWLKIHLVALSLEMMLSWVITILGIWKGHLVKSAKIM